MKQDVFSDFPRLDTLIVGLDPNLKDYFATYYEESKFGLKLVFEDLIESSKERSILEIGSGIGLLSRYLASKGFEVTAIEPAGQGFGMMSDLQEHVRKHFETTDSELRIYSFTLEDFNPNAKYDYIFSINVFEHIKDPLLGLIKTNLLLEDGGFARIITPNYSVPYEPHFNIPIFFSKRFTYAIFRHRILSFDCFDPIGLWNSLNWISIRRIQKILRQNSINGSFSLSATSLYFDRLEGESQFLARKGQFFKFIAYHLRCLLRFIPSRLYPILDLTIMNHKQGLKGKGDDNV